MNRNQKAEYATKLALATNSDISNWDKDTVKEVYEAVKSVMQGDEVGQELTRNQRWDLFKAHRAVLETCMKSSKTFTETSKVKARKDRSGAYEAVEDFLRTHNFLDYLMEQFTKIHDGDGDTFLLIANMRVLKFIENAQPFYLNIGGDSSGGKTNLLESADKLMGFIPFTFVQHDKDGDTTFEAESRGVLITEITNQSLYYNTTVEGQIVAIDEAFISNELARIMRKCFRKNELPTKDTVGEGKGRELQIAMNLLFITCSVNCEFSDEQDLNRRFFTKVQPLDKERSDMIKSKINEGHTRAGITNRFIDYDFIDAVWSWIEARFHNQVPVYCEIESEFAKKIVNPRQYEMFLSLASTHAFYRTIMEPEHDVNEEDLAFAERIFKDCSHECLKEAVTLTKRQIVIAELLRSMNPKQMSFNDVTKALKDKKISLSPAKVREACVRDKIDIRSHGEFRVNAEMGTIIWNGGDYDEPVETVQTPLEPSKASEEPKGRLMTFVDLPDRLKTQEMVSF